jgi:hypothetical protein
MTDIKNSTLNIKLLQAKQQSHDIKYHPDILYMGIGGRMSHVVHHLTKYLSSLFHENSESAIFKKTFVDCVIMTLSAANQLGIRLSTLSYETHTDNFISSYIKILAVLAKACESSDHQEDYPIRRTWNNEIKNMFLLLLSEAEKLGINIEEEVSERLSMVESANELLVEQGGLL